VAPEVRQRGGRDDDDGPPAGAAVSSVEYRVPFFDTDAMRVVHHANYVRWFELARVEWMDRNHVPYLSYVELGLHLATTRLECDYKWPARFDDRVTIATWATNVRGASLEMAYLIECDGRTLVTGLSEHACVDDDGRVRRIPKEWREQLRAALAPNAD
jgi:acyl-CoA thioester hydrolase